MLKKTFCQQRYERSRIRKKHHGHKFGEQNMNPQKCPGMSVKILEGKVRSIDTTKRRKTDSSAMM